MSQFTDDRPDALSGSSLLDGDALSPGEMVRIGGSDETPRYLGPSSGIAMSRLLMEAAKRYTESNRISELYPDVRDRKKRVPSVVMANTVPVSRKRSYPMVSDCPATTLPTRPIATGLVEVFCQRGMLTYFYRVNGLLFIICNVLTFCPFPIPLAQIFCPVLHEKVFVKELDDVYQGDSDPYKNFVVHMVFAISLQKLDSQYAGLADSYYLAAMQHFEEVVRPKDLKTLQALVLIGQYSLLTPTRTALYFIIGLATRICQQNGLVEEKTITSGYPGLVDPLTLDMRRRLCWIVATMEIGLAYSMGRPSGLARTDDSLDVRFFAAVDDANVTEHGIIPSDPPCERKSFAIHLYKVSVLEAEILRVLYENKRAEPRDDSHPWYAKMSGAIQDWIDQSPEKPPWSRPW